MREFKVYQKSLSNWMSVRITAQKSQGEDNYRIKIREGKNEYILSNPAASGITMEEFKRLEELIKSREAAGKPIIIEYTKRHNKNWIRKII